MAVKQVIVMRKDLGMRLGKMITQGSHASMAFLAKEMQPILGAQNVPTAIHSVNNFINTVFDPEVRDWIGARFTKICVRADSEEELDELYDKAMEAGLRVQMIVDAGATEFHNVPTKTCLAIGPHEAERIDAITGHLKLL